MSVEKPDLGLFGIGDAELRGCDHTWVLFHTQTVGPAPGFEDTPWETNREWYCSKCRKVEWTHEPER